MAGSVIGKTFGSSQLVEQIGEGGMGAVYKGYQASIDRYVAVKLLPADLLHDPNFLSRFHDEARALARLNHPNILPIYEYGEANGVPYIVMPLMSGGSFNDRLANGPLALPDLVRCLNPIAAALDFAHKQSILHRDVKPRNILFDARDVPYLADFGLSQFVRPNQTIGEVSGTPAYMSPEQGRGDRLDGRADVYSLGVLVFEALVGRLPFHSKKPLKLVIKHINEPPPRPKDLRPEISSAVEEIILKALAKNPDDRYQTAAEFLSALSNAAYLSRGFWRPAARDAGPSQPLPPADSESSITVASVSPDTHILSSLEGAPQPPDSADRILWSDGAAEPEPPPARSHNGQTVIASADEMDQLPKLPDPYDAPPTIPSPKKPEPDQDQ